MSMWFGELVTIFNGCWFEKGVMVHYCSGADCCPRGILDTRTRGGQALNRTVFKDRPVVPQLSRWSKGVASLDFWLLGMFVHEIVLLTFTESLVKAPSGTRWTCGRCCKTLAQVASTTARLASRRSTGHD